MMEDDNRDSADNKQRAHGQSKKIKITLLLEMPHLPQEIIEEILVRSPVKALLKFRCVSKSWLSLISSPKFIKAHVACSTLDPTFANYRLMLCISNDPFRVKHSSVSSVFRDVLTDDVEAEFPNTQTRGVSSIVGSCNGLLCVCVYGYSGTDFFLWNPCLRMSKKLPPLIAETKSLWASTNGVGYDEVNDDYKVVRLFQVHHLSDVMVEIYSLKSHSWKIIEGVKGCHLSQSSAVYAYGKFLFEAYFENSDICTAGFNIVSLDVENEVYGTVAHPEVEGYYSGTSMGVLKGCIVALYRYSPDYANVWVLKEYEVQESWTKLVRIPYVDRGWLYSDPLCVLSNGKVLLRRGSQLVVYNPKDNSFLYPRKGNMYEVRWKAMYVESLVPLPS